MIVTVSVMSVMKMAANNIIGVVTMRDRRMTAVCTMDMARVMCRTCVCWRTCSWIRSAHFKNMFIHMVPMFVVKMSIVKVVDVIPVFNFWVPATGFVFMWMILMFLMAHGFVPFDQSLVWLHVAGLELFARMVKDSMKQLLHMGVCEGIVDVLSVSTLLHKALTAEHAKALRDKRQPLPFCNFVEFRHAALTVCQRQKKLQAPRIGNRLEDARGPLKNGA